MKKIIYLLMLAPMSLTLAQNVGINTEKAAQDAILDVQPKDDAKGLLITRVDDVEKQIPLDVAVEGMIVYDLNVSCFRGFQNGKWGECMSFYEPKVCKAYIRGEEKPREFMCYNLGADESTNYNDADENTRARTAGAYYRYGAKDPVTVSLTTKPKSSIPKYSSGQSAQDIHGWGDGNKAYNNSIYKDRSHYQTNIKGPNDPCPGNFRIPNRWEMESVFGSQFVTSFQDPRNKVEVLNDSNLKGLKVISKEGNTTNELIIPMAGRYDNSKIDGYDKTAYLWTDSRNASDKNAPNGFLFQAKPSTTPPYTVIAGGVSGKLATYVLPICKNNECDKQGIVSKY
ncbi:hypothetical protein [Ornithobacterium rhinotracheale]|uniref:hypothetical protein n=1 Tax=Ornithobacterium rhinotracheale TaxID=28251 RepID=UPI0040374775